MRTVGQPPPDELPVEFFDGPWDGVVIVLRMPPPATTCVRREGPTRRRDGRPLRVDVPTEIPPGPHIYEREMTSAGFIYHYRGSV